MKLMIVIGIFVGSSLGGWLGTLFADGNWLSAPSIILSFVGSFAGIWGGCVIYRDYL